MRVLEPVTSSSDSATTAFPLPSGLSNRRLNQNIPPSRSQTVYLLATSPMRCKSLRCRVAAMASTQRKGGNDAGSIHNKQGTQSVYGCSSAYQSSHLSSLLLQTQQPTELAKLGTRRVKEKGRGIPKWDLQAILPLLSVETELGLPIYVAATAWPILTIYRYLEEVQGTKAPRQIKETILAYTTTGIHII